MLIDGHAKPDGQPLTHTAYLRAWARRVGVSKQPAALRVQVRKRFGREALVLCARVIEIDTGSDSGEWFKVDCDQGTLWVESRNVRLCAGDGRCTCEIEDRERVALDERCPAPGTATRCETSRLERGPAERIATAGLHARTASEEQPC